MLGFTLALGFYYVSLRLAIFILLIYFEAESHVANAGLKCTV